MKNRVLVALIGCVLSAPTAAAIGSDETKIRALEGQQAVAWNAHDIRAYVALFTADANVVNVLGRQWRSRAELERKLGQAFGSVFARSHLRIASVSVDFLKPDVAIAHVRWTMTGAMSPTGSELDVPHQGIQTQVLVRRGRTWRISDFQNTNSVPERTLPPSR